MSFFQIQRFHFHHIRRFQHSRSILRRISERFQKYGSVLHEIIIDRFPYFLISFIIGKKFFHMFCGQINAGRIIFDNSLLCRG